MFNSKEHIERVTMACQIQLKAHSNGEKMSMNEAFERAKSEQPRQNVILSAEQYQEYRKANPSEEQWHNTFGWWVLGLGPDQDADHVCLCRCKLCCFVSDCVSS